MAAAPAIIAPGDQQQQQRTSRNGSSRSSSSSGARSGPMGTRITRPPTYRTFPQGGITIIPRRGFEGWYREGKFTGALATQENLYRFAAGFPCRLSELLGAIHPTGSKAQSNWLVATTSPESARLFAYKGAAGAGRDVKDDAQTQAIGAWLDSHQGMGKLHGLRVIGGLCLLHYGLFPLEAIPGPSGTGVRIGLVDPLSIEFGIDNETGEVIPFQIRPDLPERRRRLDTGTFFWKAHNASVTNPYGVPVFSAAVEEMLRERGFDQDVGDAVHNSAWQRYVYKYSTETLYRIATSPAEQGGLGLPLNDVERDEDGAPIEGGEKTYPVQEWVDDQLQAVKDYLASLRPDDNLIADSAGGVDSLEAASFEGIESLVQHKDYRLIRALDELPTTMGAPKAGGQTYTTAEWSQQATKYETLITEILDPILEAANLHLRLQGVPMVVRAQIEPIRKSDIVQDANAEMVKTNTRFLWLDRRITTLEDVAIELTGSGVPEETGEEGRQAGEGEGGEGDGEGDTAGLPQEGTTTEERDANR